MPASTSTSTGSWRSLSAGFTAGVAGTVVHLMARGDSSDAIPGGTYVLYAVASAVIGWDELDGWTRKNGPRGHWRSRDRSYLHGMALLQSECGR